MNCQLPHQPPPDTQLAEPLPGQVDFREQLTNGKQCGPIHQVSIPEAMITSLHTIMLDVDGSKLSDKVAEASTLLDPTKLFEEVVQHWLGRHPILSAAEVRSSGSGLHVLAHLSPSVEFEHDGERRKWAAVVRVLQHTLPSDPNAPGITAMTRPLGSVNGKNQKKVECLRQGVAVTPQAVLDFCREVQAKPFGTVARILLGPGPFEPCPLCRAAGSGLGIMDFSGKCYAGCGTVKLPHLFSHFLLDSASAAGVNS